MLTCLAMRSLFHYLRLLVLCFGTFLVACGPSLYEQRQTLLQKHIRDVNELIKKDNAVAKYDRATLTWGEYFESAPITGTDETGRLVLKWIRRRNRSFDGSFDSRGRGTFIPGYDRVLAERLTLYFDPKTKVQLDGWYEAASYIEEHD